ncbi:uncharacterized protein LOC116346652 [Contarinia nasturtii]|uniref:uncharacterized protein LOC116346652 n=1 Tax=Contarinia nasturtii TaxID=265458 RepID=UPI0012D44E71|nr:uncharacterized protein LOC116346652 [Contarinia nasturtii]
MIAVTVFVALITWAIVKYVLHMRHTESYVKNLKFVTPFVPFFGNILTLIRISGDNAETFSELFETVKRQETPLKSYIGHELNIILDKPEDVKTILTSPNCLDKPFMYNFFPYKHGLLNERSGKRWKPIRKLFNPMFNLKMLQSFIPIFNEKTRKLVKQLEKEVGNRKGFDIEHYVGACNLDSICTTIMGLDIDLNSSGGKEFIRSFDNIHNVVARRIASPWTYFDSIYRWTNLYKEEEKEVSAMRFLTNKVFDEKTRAHLALENNNPPESLDCGSKRAHLPIIPLYFEGKLSEELVKQQIETFLGGGYETTALITSFTILTLSMHPHIQEQVFDELHSVYETQDEETTYEHIRKLHLLDRVIKETMRLLPLACLLLRTTTAEIPISKCTLPRDTSIIISVFTMHRRKDIWGDDANDFNPDHFLPENVEKRHPFAFAPFSLGPRNCIGHQYAMFSMKVMLSTILRKFKFSPVKLMKMSDLKLTFEITLKLVDKYLVTVSPRNCNKPEDVKEILMSSNCFDKPFMAEFFPFKNGIVIESSGARWKPLRKLLNPERRGRRTRVFEENIKVHLAAKCDNPSGNSEYQWNKAHLPFIPLYIEGKMTEELVKQQIESFLIAGYETTGSATAFAILALAMHPHIQEQVFKELRLVYESQDEETTNEHIQKLHLLDRVIKETLRLFPTAPNLLRSTSDMVSISNCTLPKDTSVILSIFTMHRRKDVWGDAEEFNPYHFLPENVEKRHPFAFVPFGVLMTWAIAKYILRMYNYERYVNHLKFKRPFFPFFGNIFSFVGLSPAELFSEFVRFATESETPLKTYIGSQLVITLDKPEDVKAVLMSPNCLDKPFVYDFYPSPNGIITQRSGAKWKPVRKLLNPMFNLKTLQSFIPIFNEKTKYLVKELEKEVGKSAFDIMTYAEDCTLDEICSTVMGLDIDLKSNQGKEFIHSMSAVFDIIVHRFTRPWIHYDFTYRFTKLYKEERKLLENIRNLTNLVFDEKIKAFESNNGRSCRDDKYLSKGPHMPLIELFIEGKLSEEMVKQQIEIIIMAGFDTTATTTAYVTLMLAMHPHIQDQVFKESQMIFKAQNEDITYEHIQKMNILDRVIKETMRLFPVAALTSRVSTNEVSISNCVLPKDTVFEVAIYTLHRRRDIWGDHANEFNPDHFLPENVEKRHPFSFLPFSGGPRNCIGYQYGMFSMKIMLSAILRHYKFSTDLKMSELKTKFEILLKLENKHMVKIERRNWSN